MLNYTQYAVFGLVISVIGFYTLSLKSDNEMLKQQNKEAFSLNEELNKSINYINDKYKNTLEILKKAKSKKEVEIKYVDRIKEKIIYDKNSSCINAINSIYARLHEQRTSKTNNN